MSQNRVFKRPMPDAVVPRNSFDRSKRVSLNLSFGELVTCYSNVALAGSRWQLDVQSFFRTAQLNTAAFPRLKMETEFFCVPIRYLWSYWDNFKLGISDYNSTTLAKVSDSFGQQINNPATVPAVDLFRLYKLMDGGSWLVSDTFNKICTPMYGRYKNGLFTSSFPSDSSEYVQKQMVNLLMPAAYQKVYYDHFRNTAYESNIPWAYNLDYLTQDDRGLDGITDLELVPIFTKRYVNYRKDYFQSIFPALNFVSSSPNLTLNTIPSWIQGAVFDNSNARTRVEVGASATNPFQGASIIMQNSDRTNSIFTAQSVRALFALDKLQRSSAYAPKHVKQQYEARYGIKFNDKNSFESQRIGAFSTDIAIGEVTSMANTGSNGDPLGAIGGKGVGGRDASKLLSYNVEEDSIIIGVCYAIPRTSYDAYRFPAWSLKISQNDFFIPEFMNLGLRPMYNKEFSTIYYDSNGNMKMQNSAGRNAALGYTLPYMEYKADVDENYGLFADKDSELGQFVVHSNLRSTAVVGAGVSSDYFKVKPADMNSIFVNQNDGTESTDQLFGEITFRMPVSQNMSVHGVPSL